MLFSSARKRPSSDSSSSPTGFSRETVGWALRRISSTSSGGRPAASPISSTVGSRPELADQHALGAADLVELLDDVDRDPDRAALVGERAGDRLADPPGGVGRELEAAAPVELLDGAHQAERALLDQVEEGQAAAAVALGDRDDEPQVGLDHLLLGRLVAELDALGEPDLVRGGEQRHAADVLEEELEGVGRRLDGGRRGAARALVLLGELGGAGDRLGLLEELDAGLLEVLVDRLDGIGVEPETVDDLGDLLHAEEAHLTTADHQLPELTVARQRGHLLRRHPPPVPRRVVERTRHCP